MTEASPPLPTIAPTERVRTATALAPCSPQTANEQQLADIQARLHALSSIGAEHFDPVRWRVLKLLLLRVEEQSATVACHIAGRVATLLKEYEARFLRARTRAEQDLANITVKAAPQSATAQQLFDQCRFQELTCLHTRLACSTHQKRLRELTRRLDQPLANAAHHPQNSSFTESLRQQDRDLAAAEGLIPAGAASIAARPQAATSPTTLTPATANTVTTSLPMLKAARYVHESREQHHAKRLLKRAIAQCPADSGPLNPERLIIRSLATMHGLSPHYVKRLVTQTHSLLWLEQAGAQITPKKTQKKKSMKTAKKRR